MKLKKILTLMCCAVLLVCISVGATVAYLTATDDVTNTFSVGNISIVLDEADVDGSKTNVTTEGRDQANNYHLLPSTTYDKDPTVHIGEGSENSWIFVKVENGIADIETTEEAKTIVAQIKANGWTELANEENVYYKTYEQGDDTDMIVFEHFTIADNVSNDTLAANQNDQIKITAYAIQAQGLDTVEAAWEAGNW